MSKAKIKASISHDTQAFLGEGLDVVAKKYPRLFMGVVHHRTTEGKMMTFDDKPWLTPIYKDNARNMVIIKCSQVHMTEHALCAMYTLANKGHRGMYILPSKEHRKTFVADRINAMKDFSSLYENAIKTITADGDSNVYKNIFGKGWKFVGSNVKKDFFEFPCNVLFFDEYDELDQDNLWYAYDRVSNKAYPIIWKFGNPTRENFGIHAEYMASDQKEWHVTCNKCGHEQILEWETHFVYERKGKWKLRNKYGHPICLSCEQPFRRLGYGRWIAMNPTPDPVRFPRASGYRVTRLFVNKDKDHENADIAKLFKRFLASQNNPTALQNFYNNYLGQTYENVDFKVTRDVLARSVFKDVGAFEFDPTTFRTIMGVDQGRKFSCTISIVWKGEIVDVYYTNVDRWKDVEKLEQDWNVVCTVIDAQGGGYADTRDFVRARGNRWMCFYRPKDQIKGDKPYMLNYKDQTVITNRTECIDLMVKQIIEKKTHVRADYGHAVNGFYVHEMLEPARKTDNAGRPIWTKGKDHFFHSAVYRYLAFRVSGMSNSVEEEQPWHAGRPAEAAHTEPEARIIGEIDDEPTSKPKKQRKWHV